MAGHRGRHRGGDRENRDLGTIRVQGGRRYRVQSLGSPRNCPEEALDTGLGASLECVTAKHRRQGWSIGQDPVSGVWSASRRLTQSTQQWTVRHTLAELDARLDELDGTGD